MCVVHKWDEQSAGLTVNPDVKGSTSQQNRYFKIAAQQTTLASSAEQSHFGNALAHFCHSSQMLHNTYCC